MINWSETLVRWDVNHPFLNAREISRLKSFLTNMGFLGNHTILAEGYVEENIHYSEGTIGQEEYADEMPSFWVELLEECVDTSRSGFNYPLNRAQMSNAKQGYQTAKDTKKAGDYFVDAVFEMLVEVLYEFGAYDTYRIKPWAFKVVEASGDIDKQQDRNDNEIIIGGMSWTIEINPLGIYKDVDE